MPAFFYAPGAVEHYVSFRDGSSYYLGTATTAPEIEDQPAYLNIQNDLGGRSLPTQLVGDRSRHIVTTTLNRFDWPVYKTLVGAVNPRVAPVGGHTNSTQGTLVLGVLDFQLSLVFVNSLAGNVPENFTTGRRYYSTIVVGARESTVGTRVEEVTLVLQCNELFDSTTRAFGLYTEVPAAVIAGLPALT